MEKKLPKGHKQRPSSLLTKGVTGGRVLPTVPLTTSSRTENELNCQTLVSNSTHTHFLTKGGNR